MSSPEVVGFSPEEMRTICSSALFKGFDRLQVVRLLTQFDARRMSVRDGADIADEQSVPARMGVLLSGFLHIYDSALKGQRHLVRIVRPGQVLGATLVGAHEATCPALVSSYGESVLATFSIANVDKFVKTVGGLFYTNLSMVVRKELQASWRKIAILSCSKISERVMLTLQNLSQQENSKTFAIGSTEAEFADYLGVSRSALARILRKLSKEGRFTYKRDIFTLA